MRLSGNAQHGICPTDLKQMSRFHQVAPHGRLVRPPNRNGLRLRSDYYHHGRTRLLTKTQTTINAESSLVAAQRGVRGNEAGVSSRVGIVQYVLIRHDPHGV